MLAAGQQANRRQQQGEDHQSGQRHGDQPGGWPLQKPPCPPIAGGCISYLVFCIRGQLLHKSTISTLPNNLRLIPTNLNILRDRRKIGAEKAKPPNKCCEQKRMRGNMSSRPKVLPDVFASPVKLCPSAHPIRIGLFAGRVCRAILRLWKPTAERPDCTQAPSLDGSNPGGGFLVQPRARTGALMRCLLRQMRGRLRSPRLLLKRSNRTGSFPVGAGGISRRSGSEALAYQAAAGVELDTARAIVLYDAVSSGSQRLASSCGTALSRDQATRGAVTLYSLPRRRRLDPALSASEQFGVDAGGGRLVRSGRAGCGTGCRRQALRSRTDARLVATAQPGLGKPKAAGMIGR